MCFFFSMLSPPKKKKPIRFENKSVKTYLAKEKPAKMAPPCQFPPAGEGAGKDKPLWYSFLPSFLSPPLPLCGLPDSSPPESGIFLVILSLL